MLDRLDLFLSLSMMANTTCNTIQNDEKYENKNIPAGVIRWLFGRIYMVVASLLFHALPSIIDDPRSICNENIFAHDDAHWV